MPNGWSFNWGKITRENGKPRDTVCRKLAYCVPVCVILLSLMDTKRTVPLTVRGK
jgi:hypothetical protein